MNNLPIITAQRDTGTLVQFSSIRNFPNGTILIVPHGFEAIFYLNGRMDESYPPGRYELSTGVSPFFTKLQTWMTKGLPPIDAGVYFVNTELITPIGFSTGEVLVHLDEKYTVHLAGEVKAYVKVKNPRLLLATISNWSEVTADTFEQYASAIGRQMVQTVLAQQLQHARIYELTSRIDRVCDQLQRQLTPQFSQWGITISKITAGNLLPRENEIQTIQKWEAEYKAIDIEVRRKRALFTSDLDNTADELNRFYGGDIYKKKAIEAMFEFMKNNNMGLLNSIPMIPIGMALGQTVANGLAPQMENIRRASQNIFEKDPENNSTESSDTHKKNQQPQRLPKKKGDPHE
jgi:membrane protease subunit (stomatin/prohibitin family)